MKNRHNTVGSKGKEMVKKLENLIIKMLVSQDLTQNQDEKFLNQSKKTIKFTSE